ncbi:MAG TPA: STAS domain-containing protein [Smithellaceae bacterium]|nr:STAS domain-containing protein [Smithellaceae bacterium]
MFEYTITQEPACQCVAVRGRIDALSAADLQNVFNTLILEGSRMLLADLSGVNYVSSAGLRIFIGAQKALKKVGGELLLAGLTPQVFDIFQVSGFDKLFRIVSGPADIATPGEVADKTSSLHLTGQNGVTIDYLETGAKPGRLFPIGNTDKLEHAAYIEADVVTVAATDMRHGLGLAALGETFDDYGGLFGEAMVIDRTFFYYPAVRHPSVDFLQSAHTGSAVYKFLHGFGFNGDYRFILSFQAENGAIDLNALMSGFLAIAQSEAVGVVLLAESRGLWGMNMKKPPVSGAVPDGSESIFDARRFPEWFDFPVEPASTGAVVAACGIAAREPGKLPQPYRSLFTGDNPFHLHAGVFEKAPLKNKPPDFESELARVFNELTVYKIQHLLGQSRFAGGLAGLVPIEV